jgi:hypothetical protein
MLTYSAGVWLRAISIRASRAVNSVCIIAYFVLAYEIVQALNVYEKLSARGIVIIPIAPRVTPVRGFPKRPAQSPVAVAIAFARFNLDHNPPQSFKTIIAITTGSTAAIPAAT